MTTIQQTQKKRELIRRLYSDPVFYIENFLYIRTKDAQLKKLKLNRTQKTILKYIVECLENDRPIRMIILKARQEGVSTVIEAVLFWWTNTRKNVSSRIIAHDNDATNAIFNMSKLYYDHLNPLIRPLRKYSNRKEIYFANPDSNSTDKGMNSRIIVSTAGNEQAGRGESNQAIHFSESAFFKNPEEIMAGMLQTVPMKPNTMVFVESTANGIGGWFYDEYQRASRGDSTFKAFFFPWFEHDEYKMEVPEGFELNEEEMKVKEQFKLTDEQMAWRRMKKSELASTDGKWEQEYPATAEESFISSGRPRFDVEALKSLERRIKEPLLGYMDGAKFKADPKGTLKIWSKPFQGSGYVIGVDVAEGLEKGDNSVIQVIDRQTSEQVAEWALKVDPDQLGEKVYWLGRWYNDALVGVEANNHGLTTLTELRNLNYPRLYFRKILDDKTKRQTTKMGWMTSVKTKPLMIDDMAQWIREQEIKINSKQLIRECLTYVIDDRGRTNAQSGCLDDRVMSFALALQMYKFMNIETDPDPRIKFKKY